MRFVYRAARGALTVIGLTGLLACVAWHILALRIAAVTRAEGGYVTRGWGRYRWF